MPSVFTEIIELVLAHSYKYFGEWPKLNEWEQGLAENEQSYSGVKLKGLEETEKLLERQDGARELIDMIDEADLGGGKGAGVRTTPLGKLHVFLWRCNIALLASYKA